MRVDESAAVEAVLLDALRRKSPGEPVSTARSWAQNGGSSLEAYAAVMRIEQELGVVLAVSRLLGPRSLSELCTDAVPLPDADLAEPDRGAAPATASQRRHWRHARDEGSAAFLNMAHALLCTRDFDADRAESAFRALVARHGALRSRYVLDSAGRLLLEEVAGWPERVRFHRHPPARTVDEAEAVVRTEGGRSFALGQEPPVRGGCVPLAGGAAVVYLCVHHVTADGWSIDLLADDFLALYHGDELPAATPFGRYAATLDARARAGEYAEDIAYWRGKFARVSPDFTIAGRDGKAGAQRAAAARLVWDGADADAVRGAARTLGVTVYSLMLSALLVAAHVMSGEDDVVVMSGVANRNRADYRDTVGLFTNQIFFVAGFPEPGEAGDYVRRVHADVVESLTRSELPIEVVLDELGAYAAARTLAPYANILFQAADAPIQPLAARDGSWRPLPLGTGSIKRHCNLHLVDTTAELVLTLDYSIAIVGERDAGRLLRALHAGVAHIVAAPPSPVTELVETVREAAGEREAGLTVFTVDYPGARVEPALSAYVRETFPDVTVVELAVPRSLAAQEMDQCLRRCQDVVGAVEGPAVVLAYCSAAAWAGHLASGVPVVTVSGVIPTERDWVEEAAVLLRKIDLAADLSTLDKCDLPAEGRLAAAAAVLATMRTLLESAMRHRYGEPVHRAVRETMEVQLSWLAYLGSCVVLGPGQAPVEELEGSLGDGNPELADRLGLVLDKLAGTEGAAT